jgi:hypothetical protein
MGFKLNPFTGTLDFTGNGGGGSVAWGGITGTLSNQTDLQTALNAKQATLVSGTNIKTINSTSLLGSGDITISASPGGSDTQIQYNDGGNFGGDANFTWDKTGFILGLGAGAGISPTTNINALGDGTALSITTPAGTSTDNPGGAIRITSGNGQSGGNAQGGNFSLTGGNGTGSGSGGNFSLKAGNSGPTNTPGGQIQIIAGNGAIGGNNAGGEADIFGGNSRGNAAAGNIGLFPGAALNTGTNGHLFIEDPNSGADLVLDTSLISTGRTQTFPNQTGLFMVPFTDRSTAQIAAKTLASYTVGAADGSFLVSANVLVTTATLHSFTATVTYTDEGNTSRTVTLNFSTLAGALTPTIANAGGAVPYEGLPLHIRAKSGTTITIATTGTFTTVTYNVEGMITQIS